MKFTPLGLNVGTQTKWALAAVLLLGQSLSAKASDSPSFDCTKTLKGSIEEMICKDTGLIALDLQLNQVYNEATKLAQNEHPSTLKSMQKGWVKGRNECWKSEDKQQCVTNEYQHRIAELQAQYRLVEKIGPMTYRCNGDTNHQLVVNFFKTQPATLIAEYGDSVSLMFIDPSASGAKYQGRNESFWEHHGEAKVVWGYEAPEMSCKLVAQSRI